MTTDDVKVGQMWESRDGGSVISVRKIAGGKAWGPSPDGSRWRGIKLDRLVARGRTGYNMIKDAEAP
jgi:hypothetical protein